MDIAKNERFDVIVLGSGFEGGLLATILAHQGVSVLMIDGGSHPRFALGESTVRHAFRMLRIMAERWKVPEIEEKFSRAELIHEKITSSCGEKRNCSFLYHREGQHQLPHEANQLVIAPYREGYEAHLYRQDIDAWLTYTAIHHGAKIKYNTKLTGMDTDSNGVTLTTGGGEKLKARYIVDASGQSAVLGRLLDIQDNPPRLKLNSRCLFTHMIDVKPYDDLDIPTGVPRLPDRLYNGTCHHIFDGGWVWVIPFDNRKGWTNPAVSVGLSYDNVRYPRPTDKTPQAEWDEFLDRFPSIKAQFKDAKPIRDWVSTDRLQTSAKQAVGERYFLTAAAYGSGFIDGLFSRGLANSVEILNAFIPRLLKALQDDDFSTERFAYLEQLHQNTLRNNDLLVNAGYISFRNYELWDTVFRTWVMGVSMGDLRLAAARRRYTFSHDESVLPDHDEPLGLFFSNHRGYGAMFEQIVANVEQVDAGTMTAEEATRHNLGLLGGVNFIPPVVRLGDPTRKYHHNGKLKTIVSAAYWALTTAPPEVRDVMIGSFADVSPLRLLKRNRPVKPVPVVVK